jgi:hypothetical protein
MEHCIVMESFPQNGLERRLRWYEHVRDVLNSWGRDGQNGLTIVSSSSTNGQNEDLAVAHVPREQPAEVTVYLYHSSQRDKWKKRWVTLRADGQMVVSKKPGQPPKHTINICHLSDSDVYFITPRHMAKVLKPPKRYCIAVKSQEKSSLFLSAEKYLHYFATDDKKLADFWYKTVQEWRSWYLVNRLGAGSEAETGPRRAEQAQSQAPRSHRAGSSGGRTNSMKRDIRAPSSSRHSQPLLAQPLLDDRPPTEHRTASHAAIEAADSSPSSPDGGEELKTSKLLHNRNMSKREHRPPPLSFPAKMRQSPPASPTRPDGVLIPGMSPQEMEDATFAPTGLLGRNYTVRKAAQERESNSKKQDGHALNGHSVLHADRSKRRSADETSTTPVRSQSVRSSHGETTARPRTASTAQRPKPLLDFSKPEFREPPQHARKGRGYVPTQPLPGGLVDAATSPEVAIPVPPATAWRRQNPVPPPPPLPDEKADARRAQAPVHVSERGRQNSLPAANPKAAADGKLSAVSIRRFGTQRDPHMGRGVRTGDRNAQAPMLDFTEPSKFVPGSLLAKAELERG